MKYRTVVFLQEPAEFDRWYVEYDEHPDQGFKYLLQWEYGDDIPLEDSVPWGTSDSVVYFKDGDNEYVICYNWHLSYVGLTQVIEGN